MIFFASMEYSKVFIVVVMLLYTAWLDVRTREVTPRTWLFFMAPLLIITSIELLFLHSLYPVILALTGIIVVIGSVGVLYYAGLMGGGDLYASVIIAIAHPWNPFRYQVYMSTGFVPFCISVLIYSSLLVGLLSIFYFILNLFFNRKELVRVPRKYRYTYLFTGLPVRAVKLLYKRFWYPLEHPWRNKRYSVFFDVGEEEEDFKRALRNAIENGLVSPDQKLWSTYGVPFILFIFLGYVFSLLIGDSLLLNLISRII